MKKTIIIICILTAFSLNLKAQLLEDGVNIYAGYQTGFFAGHELYNNSGVIAPSFYRSLTTTKGAGFSHTFRIAPLFSTGYKASILSSDNWKNENYNTYSGSKLMMFSLHPVFLIHNKFQESGLFNRLKLYGSLAPVVGLSRLEIVNNSIYFQGYLENPGIFNSTDVFFGLEAGAGVELNLRSHWGIFLDLSVQESFVKSPFYNDTYATLVKAGIGVKYNIAKQKRFNY